MVSLFNGILIISTALYFVTLLLFFIGLFFPNRRRTGKQYSVSVVVAARNEEQNIGNLLSDLTRQTYPAEQYEIIVVDDGSVDATHDIGMSFSKEYPNVKIIDAVPDPDQTLVAKKNAIHQGIIASGGEIILMTDADCRVKSQWIETMVSYFTPETGMVVGFSQLGTKNDHRPLFEKLQATDFLALLAGAQGSINLNFPLAATGQNLAYRKSAYLQVDGFKDIGHRVSGDDVLLLQLIHNRTDWEIRFAPDEASFNTSLPEENLKDLINQRKRWASNGSYQLKLNKKFFVIVVNTFLINLLILISLPFIFTKNTIFSTLLCCMSYKLLIEFIILVKGAFIYHRTDLIKYFPVWAILQIPYIIFVGALGNIGRFVWKGRRN
ncbi:glycosyltransferase [candidate division KSB1 bacterium]|nr:glycosyltransferase [candidate division KSB1 bacterium]